MTRSRRALRFPVFAAVLGLILVLAVPVQAQDAGTPSKQSGPANQQGSATLSVSPAIIDDTFDAGATFTVPVTLSNVSSNALAIHASASGLVPDQKVDPQYASAYDASSWFALDTPDFLLPPNQQQVENLTISVPKDVEPGGHYATIYFESFAPNQSSGSASATINPRVGVLALLVVRGDVREHADASGPIMAQGFQGEAGPTALSLNVHNDGNVHLLPYGSVVIRNIFGQKVKTLPLPLGTLLPGTTREYDMQWDHGLRFGVYNASATITVGSQKLVLTPQSKRFVLFPLVIAMPVAFLVIVVVGFLVWRKRRVRRRRLRRLAVERQLAEQQRAAEQEESSERTEPTDAPESG